jgi:hypothetical protein
VGRTGRQFICIRSPRWLTKFTPPVPRPGKASEMAAGPRRFAYVTLLTRNSYLPGLLVLWFSLREVESRYPLVVMVTHTLPLDARDLLRKVDIRMIEAEPVRPAFEHYLATSDFRFADTWTKLRYGGSLRIPQLLTLIHRGFELVEFDVNTPLPPSFEWPNSCFPQANCPP